ncbi:auxin-responsive protein SAUR68-like [Punica granatum]|uniref:Auxin-responsive protein SAUR68-like n=2 Tax=Punica granatum TaxID=22663 RepID=A0A6P8CG56_PUNGR|nr:auxin-responsive protein SAUR68-like [Punica granatum]
MISGKKLIAMARKWQKEAVSSRRITSLPSAHENSNDMPFVADKGHFVVYTADRRRFMVPLSYLQNNIFQELFKMSEDEFGYSRDGPITVPCDAVAMEYVVSLVQRGLAKDLEKALLDIMASSRCTAATSDEICVRPQVLVCGH